MLKLLDDLVKLTGLHHNLAKMTAIFFYGTLLDAKIREYVFANSIRDEQLVAARAEGYRTMTYPGESFPILVEAVGSVVNGLLLLDPSPEALERMAFYEGELYWLDDLEVMTVDGETLPAKYNRASEEGLVLEQEWRFSEWQSTTRDALLEISQRPCEEG